MEDKKVDSRVLYLIIGILIAVIIFLAGGKLTEINFFGTAKFEFPTETPIISQTQSPTNSDIPESSNATLPSPSAIPTEVSSSPIPTNTSMPSTAKSKGNCPFRELADEINIGNNTGACETISVTKFLEIIDSASIYSAIDALDKAFEADIRTGYQYRELIPARIPPAPERQRVMWGSLTWIDELASSEREDMNSRIFRIWCNYTNPCIYVILDGDEFYAGHPGRGILLSDPLLNNTLNGIKR